MTPPLGRIGMLRLALRALFRRLNTETDFQVVCAEEVWIEARRKRLRVAIDGEISLMRTPLHFCVGRGALRVIAPAGKKSAGR